MKKNQNDQDKFLSAVYDIENAVKDNYEQSFKVFKKDEDDELLVCFFMINLTF